MSSSYERHLIVTYLANTAARLHHRDREAASLAEWVADSDNRSAYESKRLFSHLVRAGIEPEEGISARQLRCLRQALREELSAEKRTKYDRPAQRLRCLGEATGLSPTDVDILELLLRYQTQPVIESLVDEIFLRVGRRTMPLNVRGAAMPALLGISAGAIHNRLADGAPLVSSGLVSIDGDGDVTIVDRLRRLATVPGSAGLDASRLLLDAAPASELEWSDFDHIAEGRDHIERLIQGALRTSAPGVNILLYGPPGTGKTEFCKVLAERTRRDSLQRGRSGRRWRRAEPQRETAGAAARPAPSRPEPRVAPPLRRDGGPAVGLRLKRSVALRATISCRWPERKLQDLHAPPAGASADADPLGHERREFGQ